jgi:hypothetical protein
MSTSPSVRPARNIVDLLSRCGAYERAANVPLGTYTGLGTNVSPDTIRFVLWGGVLSTRFRRKSSKNATGTEVTTCNWSGRWHRSCVSRGTSCKGLQEVWE